MKTEIIGRWITNTNYEESGDIVDLSVGKLRNSIKARHAVRVLDGVLLGREL